MYKFPHTDCGVQAKLFCLSRADQTELILKLRAAYPGSYAPDEWLGMDDPLRYDAVRTWRLAIISCDGDHAARETVRDHSRWIMSRTAEIEPNEYIRLLAQAYSAVGSVYGATD